MEKGGEYIKVGENYKFNYTLKKEIFNESAILPCTLNFIMTSDQIYKTDAIYLIDNLNNLSGMTFN